MNRIGLFAGLLGLTVAGIAQAQENPAPRPAPKWEVNVASGECRLMREFDSPMPALFMLQTVPGTDTYGLTIIGPDMVALPINLLLTINLDFQNAAKRFNSQALVTKYGDGAMVVVPGLGPDFVQALGRASSISLTYMDPITYGPFALPSAGAAAKALEGCVRDQLVEWGADPAQFEPGGKAPVALKRRDAWVPRSELRRLARGKAEVIAVFRVAVSPEGVVEGCALVSAASSDASAADGIEKPICDTVLTKRLFKPATSLNGTPVRGAASFVVTLSR